MNTNLIECFNCDKLYNTNVNLQCPFCSHSYRNDTIDNTELPTLAEAIEKRSNSSDKSTEPADD
jgi:hypothetical protein